MIADIKGVFRSGAGFLQSEKNRIRKRFFLRYGFIAHKNGAVMQLRKSINKRPGQKSRFIGHNSPPDGISAEIFQNFFKTGEQT